MNYYLVVLTVISILYTVFSIWLTIYHFITIHDTNKRIKSIENDIKDVMYMSELCCEKEFDTCLKDLIKDCK